MKLRYLPLFNIGFTTAYYVDGKAHNDIVLEPTSPCRRQMSRYKLLSRNSPDGLTLYYEGSPLTGDATPFKPIDTEEKFAFRVLVINPDLWYYADVNGWKQDRVFFLKNPAYNTTGDIDILNGPLNTPALNRPLKFIHDIPLQDEQSLLEIRDGNDTIVKTLVIRARTTDETAGKTEGFLLDLTNAGDGLYKFTHLRNGGNMEEYAYCSADHRTGTFAIVEVTYKGDPAWTGINPMQQYKIKVSARPTDWVYEVHIRPQPMNPLIASQLFIKHEPSGAEPVETFSVVSADDVAGIVQFKSDAPLKFSQKPMHLRLVTPDLVVAKTVVNTLPLPSARTIVMNGTDLSTKIIVNI